MPSSKDVLTAALQLLESFPPAATEQWEELIRKDLKGRDYEQSLVWQTDEGIAVRPYYRSEHTVTHPPMLHRAAGPWDVILPGQEPALDVDAIEFHDAGANSVQEVAFAIAQGADLVAADIPVEAFGFAAGGNFFMEIAKLRAARVLWAQVTSGFGLPSRMIRIHARTARENKSVYDPYTNLLRATTEALSAVIGGCDSLTIVPWGFDPHLAENIHYLLAEENHIDRVVDPAAGSYYVEALTNEVGRAAWQLFQEIESAGGFAAYKASGSVESAMARTRESRLREIRSRRRVLVGVNSYPDLKERASGIEAPDGWRLASEFERIRLRTERHARFAGKTPVVLLLERGDLKMRKARSSFCLNLFGCAGFEIVESEQLIDADLVILCSSDAGYLEFAREICPVASCPVLVAGHPKKERDALEAAGVADFVDVFCDAVETLTYWQDRLGVQEVRE